jgi:hypothetical protein
MQEDLRICFGTPEDGKESLVDRALGTVPIAAHKYIVRCTIAGLGGGVKTFSESWNIAPASLAAGESNVRFGSLTDMAACRIDVRFTPESGH